MRRRILEALVLMSVVTVGSAGGAEPPAAPVVDVRLFRFAPTRLDVPAGARVTWINDDDIAHTITSGVPEQADGRFVGQLPGKGSRFDFTLGQPGTYPFFCERHTFMRGEIRVK